MSTAVCFDLDGTIVEFTTSYETILHETFEAALGYSTPELTETYNETFFEAFLALEPDPYRTGMRAVREAADTDVSPGTLVAQLREREIAATRVTDGTRSLLDSLAKRHSLAVITNGLPEWQKGKLRHHDLFDAFDTVVCSYDVGAHKPDPAPFEAAKDSLDADTYVMIGDDDADIEGAREAAFVPVHLAGGDEIRVPDLTSLSTLFDVFR